MIGRNGSQSMEFCFNNHVNRSISQTPFFITKGYHLASGVSRPTNAPISSLATQLTTIHEEAKAALQRSNKIMKEQYDQNRKPLEFKIGDKVWLDAKNVSTSRPKKKLDYKHLRPFSIISKISPFVYKLKLPSSYRIHPIFHVSLLSPVIPDSFFRTTPCVKLTVRRGVKD